MAPGRFLGTDTQYVVLNRLNSISLFELVEEAGGSSSMGEGQSFDGDEGAFSAPLGASLKLVREYPMFATLKYVESVSLYDQHTGAFLRDVLFLLSMKQEIAIVAFAAAKSVSETGGEDLSAGSAVHAVTLYHGEVDGCLYQYFPGEAHLIASSPKPLLGDVGSRVSLDPPHKSRGALPGTSGQSFMTPYVVFAVSRGELFVLDVLAALGKHAKHHRASGSPPQRRKQLHGIHSIAAAAAHAERVLRDSLFPPTLWQLAADRAGGECVSKCALHSAEYEVRDVAFLRSPSAVTPLSSSSSLSPSVAARLRTSRDGDLLTLLLLFADIHGRTHVSTYSLSCAAPLLTAKHSSAAAPPSAGAAAADGASTRAAPFRYLEGLLDGYDGRLTRTGLLVSNCDPTAAQLLPLTDHTLLIGSLLLTVIPHAGLGASAASASGVGGGGMGGSGHANASGPVPSGSPRAPAPVTMELPHGLELACVCPSHGGCMRQQGGVGGASASWDAFMFFKDGTVLGVCTRAGDAGVSGTSVSRLPGKLEVIPNVGLHVGAHSRFLVSSRYDDTVLVDLSVRNDASAASNAVETVVRNPGPVLDLTVMRDQVLCPTVVAATGVGKNGGISLIRAAATVTEFSNCILWPLQATRVVQAGRVVLVTSEYGSRFFCLEQGDETEKMFRENGEGRSASDVLGGSDAAHHHAPPRTRHSHLDNSAVSGKRGEVLPPPPPLHGKQWNSTMKLTRDVHFDAILSDANVVLLICLDDTSFTGGSSSSRKCNEEAMPSDKASSRYYLMDSLGNAHELALTRSHQGGGYTLSRKATYSCWHGCGMTTAVTFATATVASAGNSSSSLVALSDGHAVRCFWLDRAGVDAARCPALFEATLPNPLSCLSLVTVNEEASQTADAGTGGLIVILAGDWCGRLRVFTLTGEAHGADRGLSSLHVEQRCEVSLAAVARSIAVVAPAADASNGNDPLSTDRARWGVFAGLMDGCFQQVNLSPVLQASRHAVRAPHEPTGQSPSADAVAAHACFTASPPPLSTAIEVTRPVFLMDRPIEFTPVKGKGMLLCRGPSPLLMLVNSPAGAAESAGPTTWKASVELTGVTLTGLVDFCPCVFGESSAPAQARTGGDAMIFLTNYHGCHSVSVGSLPEVTEKTSHTFLKMGCTVTHLRHIAPWEKFALSLRHADTDVVAFLPSDVLDPAWRSPLLPSNSFSLLENERCVFMEPLYLGGDNRTAVAGEGGDGGRHEGSGRVAVGHSGGGYPSGDFVVLVGSTFVFPDEQRPRSSRMTWYRRSNDNRPTERASKDIGGQLQCCCPVPNYQGRIALGVSGCVLLFAWNPTDRTFVAEERLRIGLMITKLIPIYDAAPSPSRHERDGDSGEGVPLAPLGQDGDAESLTSAHPSRLIALDARYSAMFISIDRVQGGLSITARDKQLRGIMDGELIAPATATAPPGLSSPSSRTRPSRSQSSMAGKRRHHQQELCLCDDNMNFFCVQAPGLFHDGFPAADEEDNRDPNSNAEAAAGLAEDEGGAPAVAGVGPNAAGGTGATATPAASTSLTRLQPHAAAHLGDLVTVMQKGSLSLATVREGAFPSPQSLLPGFHTEQLVCGTTHGGLMIVSSVSRTTFVFLKCLEMALLAVKGSAGMTGGFTFSAFREVSTVGQARSLNRTVWLPPLGSASGGKREGGEQADMSELCSADVVEGYLDIGTEEVRDAVLRLAEAGIAGTFLNAGRSVGDPSSMPNLLTATPALLSSYRALGDPHDDCNAVLAHENLPTLPLQHGAVEALLLTLHRTH